MLNRRLFLSLLVILFSPAASVFGLDAGGSLQGTVSWQGEITLRQTVIVDPHAELTIAAGTQVRPLVADAKLLIRGILKVAGSAESPVSFVAPAGWQGIEFTDSAPGSVIDHARFAGAATAVSGISSSFVLRNSEFTSTGTAVKLLRGSNPLIEMNLFSDNNIGIDSEMKSAPTIRGNHFFKHKTAGILLSHSSVGVIEGNTFEQNKHGISVLQQYSDRIDGNHFADNEIGVYCNQTQNTPQIINNSFTRNRLGLANVSFAAPEVLNNTFTGNEVAIRNDQYGAPKITRNLFRGNGTSIYNYRKSNPLIEKNLIEQSGVALYCDYSSYPNVHQNNFRDNGMAVQLGIFQSGDWERQFGTRPEEQMAAQGRKARKLLPAQGPTIILDAVDVSQNWWGDDTIAMIAAGSTANLELFYDRHDQPRVFYEGFAEAGYVFDLVRYAPWLDAPAADCGPRR